jgi:hypothetical protein
LFESCDRRRCDRGSVTSSLGELEAASAHPDLVNPAAVLVRGALASNSVIVLLVGAVATCRSQPPSRFTVRLDEARRNLAYPHWARCPRRPMAVSTAWRRPSTRVGGVALPRESAPPPAAPPRRRPAVTGAGDLHRPCLYLHTVCLLLRLVTDHPPSRAHSFTAVGLQPKAVCDQVNARPA